MEAREGRRAVGGWRGGETRQKLEKSWRKEKMGRICTTIQWCTHVWESMPVWSSSNSSIPCLITFVNSGKKTHKKTQGQKLTIRMFHFKLTLQIPLSLNKHWIQIVPLHLQSLEQSIQTTMHQCLNIIWLQSVCECMHVCTCSKRGNFLSVKIFS